MFQGKGAALSEFVILRKGGEESLSEQRGGFEFVAPNGKSQDGDVNRTGAKPVEKDRRNFFRDTEKGLREFARERSEERREEIRGNSGNDADADWAANRAFALNNVASGGFELAENGTGPRQKRLTYVGEPHRAAQSVKKARAKFVFKLHDLLGKRWLRDVRLLGGTAKAAGLGDGAKVTELMELHRLYLSIVSELYIGCIGRRPLPS